MRNIVDYIFEGNKPLANVELGEVVRFNGCFRDVLTWLKKSGYGDITMHKEARASSQGVHMMHLEFKPECKSDFDEVYNKLQDKWKKIYEIWKMEAHATPDKVYDNPTIWLMERRWFNRYEGD